MSASASPTYDAAFCSWQCWLWANGLGTLGYVLFYFIIDLGTGHYLRCLLGVAIGVIAALFSVPVLGLLPLGMRWVLAQPDRFVRLAQAAAVVVGLFGTALALVAITLAVVLANRLTARMVFYALPYLATAFIATAVVYRPWLFRPGSAAASVPGLR